MIEKIYGRLVCLLSALRHPFLLILRLYWGWHFFEAGKGKLVNLPRVTGFFQDLGIPFPKLNAMIAGSVECFGGLLLLVGLGSRLVSIPLAFTMVIAYLTADSKAVHEMFSNPEGFLTAAPFLFLLAVVIVMIFGPGGISLDGLFSWLRRRRESRK